LFRIRHLAFQPSRLRVCSGVLLLPQPEKILHVLQLFFQEPHLVPIAVGSPKAGPGDRQDKSEEHEQSGGYLPAWIVRLHSCPPCGASAPAVVLGGETP
jgi:hypothetical protein